MAVCAKGTCLCIHHLQVVSWQVGDDYPEGVQDRQGPRGGEVQVRPHVVIQNVQWQLPTCPRDAYLPAEVVDALHCVQEFALPRNTAQRSTAQHTAQRSTQHRAAQRSTQHSAAPYSTAQHSTASYCTAQHSATQRSTAQQSMPH